MKFGHKTFDELGTLEVTVLFIAGLHVLALALWMFLTATQKLRARGGQGGPDQGGLEDGQATVAGRENFRTEG